jgi:hypothetical protein
MKNKPGIVFLCLVISLSSFAQQPKLWNEEDRRYLIENLIRTRDSIINETKNLSEAEWNFKESTEKWSINGIIEHLAIWELLLDREVSQALVFGLNLNLQKT